MSDTLIHPNGIDAETGEPLLPSLPVETVAAMAKGQPIAKEELDELRARVAVLKGRSEADYGVMAGVDPNDLAQAGWGVIFAFEDEAALPALREALAPLLDLRRSQAGDALPRRDGRSQVLLPAGRVDERLAQPQRRRARPRWTHAGCPTTCSSSATRSAFRSDFQYQLDVAHAVGRIHFDTLDEYHSYAPQRGRQRGPGPAAGPGAQRGLLRRAQQDRLRHPAQQPRSWSLRWPTP